MPLLLSLLGSKWMWIALLVAAVGVQTKRVGTAKAERDAVQEAFGVFKANVKAEGIAAQQRADKQAAEDKSRKEKADVENARTVALLNQRVSSLRHDADNRSAYGLPPAAPDSKRPDIACFDRAEYSGAHGRFVERLRSLADEGDAATVNLNTAKAWATGR